MIALEGAAESTKLVPQCGDRLLLPCSVADDSNGIVEAHIADAGPVRINRHDLLSHGDRAYVPVTVESVAWEVDVAVVNVPDSHSFPRVPIPAAWMAAKCQRLEGDEGAMVMRRWYLRATTWLP